MNFTLLFRLSNLLALLILTIGVSGCSTPMTPIGTLTETELDTERQEQFKRAIEYRVQQQIKLAELSYPLLLNSKKHCGKRTHYSLGIILHHLSNYPEAQKQAASLIYGDSEFLQVQHTLEKGAAAGVLFPGDLILHIGKTEQADTSPITVEELKGAIQTGNPVPLIIQRQNQTLRVSLKADSICNFPVKWQPTDLINGYADGTSITITDGLLRFANDSQIALIIAHELAHNTLHHIPKRLQNSAMGLTVDLILTGAGIPSPLIITGLSANLYSQAFETEADLEGIRLLHAAGYEINGLDDFWRDMARLNPKSINHGKAPSHPTTVERALRIKKLIQQLQTTAPSPK